MRPTLALLTLALALGVAGLAGGTGAAAETPAVGEPLLRVFGETFPARLPRGRSTPVSLKLGFESEASESHTAPRLSRIAFEVSRGVVFNPRGLPNCDIARLYETYAKPRQACPGSFLGEGNVSSEIQLPGRPEQIFAAGRLYAFHSVVEGTPYVLAQAIVSEPVQIVYVIPFKLEKRHGTFATRLVVKQMPHIYGICVAHGCGDTYLLDGVYTRISYFEMFLDRALNGGTTLIKGHCPLLGTGSKFPLVNTSILYEGSGIELDGRKTGACQT